MIMIKSITFYMLIFDLMLSKVSYDSPGNHKGRKGFII